MYNDIASRGGSDPRQRARCRIDAIGSTSALIRAVGWDGGFRILLVATSSRRPIKMSSIKILCRDHVVYDLILRNLNAYDLFRLMRTCKALENMVRDFLHREYNFHKYLRKFFMNYIGFRFMQSDTGAIISGSFALQFFTRFHYPTAALDIYVAHSGGLLAGIWLQENGYTYVPGVRRVFGQDFAQPMLFSDAIHSMTNAWTPDDSYRTGVIDIFKFEGTIDGIHREVNLVITNICPIRTILAFHSSESHVHFR